LITVTVSPHEIFQREGTSVISEIPITIVQAVLGAQLEVDTLDGKVKIPYRRGPSRGPFSGCGEKASPISMGAAEATSL
jgi:molecular chaperone DnaJ